MDVVPLDPYVYSRHNYSSDSVVQVPRSDNCQLTVAQISLLKRNKIDSIFTKQRYDLYNYMLQRLVVHRKAFAQHITTVYYKNI